MACRLPAAEKGDRTDPSAGNPRKENIMAAELASEPLELNLTLFSEMLQDSTRPDV